MSKLSPALKALIAAPFARPDTTPAPRQIQAVYKKIADEAGKKDVGRSAWLAASTAVTMTMNSPESLFVLHGFASKPNDLEDGVKNAEFMREVGLKCMGFNGVPRVINTLNAFRASLPEKITNKLSTTPTREPTPTTIPESKARGHGLWKSIYDPFAEKLFAKLAESHPDLPVHIVNSEYGLLFADPPGPRPAKVGRVLTSIAGVACLRAQSGVGPQVISHLFGLRKAYGDGSAEAEEEVQGGKWLASDEGNIWLLNRIDEIVEAIGEGQGTNFAPTTKRQSKL